MGFHVNNTVLTFGILPKQGQNLKKLALPKRA